MNIKKGIVYVFFATGIGFFINLVTNFVLPRFLSVETYADIKLYQLYITYIGILHLGFSDGMYLRLGGKKLESLNNEELVSEFRTFKIFQLIVDIVAIIISILLKNKILFLVAISILPVNTINYLRSLYQATGLYDLYSKFTTTNNIMLFLFNMFLLFLVKTDNPYIYIVGQVIVYFLNWVLIEYVIKSRIFKSEKGKFDYKYIINDIKDGILLMLGNFCNVIFTSIDRMFSKNLLGKIKFAYYSFSVSVEGLLNVFINPIVITMYNYLCNNNNYEKVTKVKRLLLVCLSFLIMSAFPVKWIINNFILKYKESSNIIFILFSAQFFSIIVKCIFNNLFKAEKKQRIYFMIIISITIIAVILDCVFYKFNQTNESFAFATLLTSIVWFIIGEICFKKYKYKNKDYLFMTIIIFSFLYCGLIIENAILGCAIYLFIVILLNWLFLCTEVKYIIKEAFNILSKFKNKVFNKNI